jgi:hypothetical protein
VKNITDVRCSPSIQSSLKATAIRPLHPILRKPKIMQEVS